MSNLEVVKSLYEAFRAHDNDRILKILDPHVEWVQNEGFPGGGKHIGSEAVLKNVFSTFRHQWVLWQVDVREWLDVGDVIVALGHYRGTYERTGKSMKSDFAHVYWLKGCRIIRFEQYADTLPIAKAMA